MLGRLPHATMSRCCADVQVSSSHGRDTGYTAEYLPRARSHPQRFHLIACRQCWIRNGLCSRIHITTLHLRPAVSSEPRHVADGRAARCLWPPASLIFTSGDGAATMRPLGESLHDGDHGHAQAYRASRYGEHVPSSARPVRPLCVRLPGG
ncbi:hypothetical protein GY45DRAFT_457395 [Cubamyces sp. BRFM 1775]|nr:hypothetical protein GY45DRAFT_457395 [Cubamyces sp. BRFM 1775]